MWWLTPVSTLEAETGSWQIQGHTVKPFQKKEKSRISPAERDLNLPGP